MSFSDSFYFTGLADCADYNYFTDFVKTEKFRRIVLDTLSSIPAFVKTRKIFTHPVTHPHFESRPYSFCGVRDIPLRQV